MASTRDRDAEARATRCGSVKPISGRKPLVCTRDTGHAGDHGVHDVTGALFVRWGR